MADAASVTSAPPAPPEAGEDAPKFITDPRALLRTLKRMRASNDNFAYRTSGGLRIMIRNDPESEPTEISFDISVIIDEESPEIVKAIKNEIDIMEDESGCIVIEDYVFDDTNESDAQSSLKAAVQFLNEVDLWTVCPCGEYLIKDAYITGAPTMCYYCECTRASDDTLEIQCPICHDHGSVRWMVRLPCCGQSMHRKCQQSCITSSALRLVDNKCPLCCRAW